MTHPFAMMLAQFEKVSKHAAQLTLELDSTPPGSSLVSKLSELKETLGQVEQTVKLMSEMADVFARFADTQIIGPAKARISEADYRRLAGLDKNPTTLDWLQGRATTHAPYIEPEYRSRSTVDEEHEAAMRAIRQGPIYKVLLPDDTSKIQELNDYIEQLLANQEKEFEGLTPEQRYQKVEELIRGEGHGADSKVDQLLKAASAQMKVFDTDHGVISRNAANVQPCEPVEASPELGADEEEGEWKTIDDAVQAGEIPTINMSVEEIALKANSRQLNVDVPDEVAKSWFKFEG